MVGLACYCWLGSKGHHLSFAAQTPHVVCYTACVWRQQGAQCMCQQSIIV
jgi:hypothetical protein